MSWIDHTPTEINASEALLDERRRDYCEVFFTSPAGRRVFVDLCRWAGWLAESDELDPAVICARRDAVTKIVKSAGVTDLEVLAYGLAYAAARSRPQPAAETKPSLAEGV
jgi:hypothetical protein